MTDVHEIKVPHSGSVQNVEITEWLISEGQVVELGDALAEVSTDKVDTELVAPIGGKVARLLTAEGDEVVVGTVVALLVDPDMSDEAVAGALASYSLTAAAD